MADTPTQAEALRQCRDALREAAQSLRTIADNAGKRTDTDGNENYLQDCAQVRGYANSRATVAHAALAAADAALSVQAEPVATVTECEACFTPDVCQLRGTCDHYAAERLRVAATPQPPALVPAVPLTPRDVARQVFALCEQFEDLQDSPADSFGVQRHVAGQRFAAKRIRNAIGDWLTEQERAHNITGGSNG